MNQVQIKRLSRSIRAVCRSSEFYAVLEQHHFDCGAFDGGCLMVATALQHCLEQGELWGVYGRRRVAKEPIQCHHAVLKIGDLYYDGNGASSEALLKYRWLKDELLTVSHLAPLPDVEFPACPKTIASLATLFRTKLFQP